MAITAVTTPAPDQLLTTMKAVKEVLGEAAGPIANEANSPFLENLILRASDKVRSLTNRHWAKERITESVPGHGNTRLMLSRSPIDTVHSVLFDGEAVTDFTINDDPDTSMLFRRAGWAWTRSISIINAVEEFPVANSEDARFVVDYTAGYILPGEAWPGPFTSEARDLPHDVEAFTIELVKAMFFMGGAEARDPNIKSERIGDWNAVYGGIDGPMALMQAEFVSKWGRFA